MTATQCPFKEKNLDIHLLGKMSKGSHATEISEKQKREESSRGP